MRDRLLRKIDIGGNQRIDFLVDRLAEEMRDYCQEWIIEEHRQIEGNLVDVLDDQVVRFLIE